MLNKGTILIKIYPISLYPETQLFVDNCNGMEMDADLSKASFSFPIVFLLLLFKKKAKKLGEIYH